jgi:hypothetical protein
LYSSEDDFGSSSQQEDSSSGVGKHCVVWGDWNFNGKLFQSQKDASAFFNSKKKTELAAVQYYGARQITRFMSKRMTRVDWKQMKGWCDKHSSGATELSGDEPAPRQTEDEAPTPKHQRNRKSRTRARSEAQTFNKLREDSATDPSLLQSQSSSMDIQQDSDSNSPALSSNSYSPSFSAAPRPANVVSVAAALEAKGSSLSGKISVLEDELGSLATKASSLLKSIDADARLGPSMVQTTVNHNGATPAAGGKLKGRLATLAEYATRIQEKAALLETEFLGAVALSENSMDSRVEAGPIKKMIEAMAGKVDALKNRFAALDGAPLLDEVSRLEKNAVKVASEASRVFKSFGVDNLSPQAPTSNSYRTLKDRLRALSGFMDNLQRSAGQLDNEMLGGGADQAQNFDGSQKSPSIKDKIVSLGENMQKMESRISALENSPIMSDVSKMEDVMTTLSSRTAGVAKAVGLSGQTSRLALAPRGSPLKMRLASLEKTIRDMEGITEALEQELSGNVGSLPNQPQTDSPIAKAKSLEMQIEALNSRMSSLEQQV